MTDGLNVFKEDGGPPALFVDFAVLRGWLQAVGIPETLIPLYYGYQSFERLFGQVIAGTADHMVYFDDRGEGRRLKRIQMAGGAQKSDFLKAQCSYLGCFLDEDLLDLLQGESTDENLKKLLDWLKDKAGISYKGLPDEGLHWIMLHKGEEKKYRPWVSRHELSCLYPLHLVCKKFGSRRVFRLLRGGEGPVTESEERALALFESLVSVEKAVAYLNAHYSPLALVMPDEEVRFSFNGVPFASLHDLEHGAQAPAPVSVLFRWHTDLPSHLEASLPLTQRLKGLSCYPNYSGCEQEDGILYLLKGKEQIPAFPMSETSMLSTKDGVLNKLLRRGIGRNPAVEGVVNSDHFERGHVLASGHVVLNFFGCASEGSSATYLLLISCDACFGSGRALSLMELNVIVEKSQQHFTLSGHQGRYDFLHGAVVVKRGAVVVKPV